MPPLRAVYVASTDQIARATHAAWEGRFGEGGLGLKVVQLTGEQQVCTTLPHVLRMISVRLLCGRKNNVAA